MHSNCFNLRPLLKKTLLCLAIALTTLPTVASEQTFGIIGDAGRATANAKSVRESLARAGVLELILPGDNLYSGTYQSVWQSWRNLNFQFPVVAIGNHNDGYPSEMSYFGMPAEYYSKVIDGVHFLVLNSDNNQSGRTQAAWLDGQLENATENLIFLVYHHPSYKISSVHTWTEKKEFQLAIRPIIWKHRHKLTALIVGHDHLASVLHFNDLPVILSGAVQEDRQSRRRFRRVPRLHRQLHAESASA